MKRFITALVVLIAGAAAMPAKADLTGTNITLSVNHDGPFGALCPVNDQAYLYGAPGVYNVDNWGVLNVSSPAVAPGYNNAMMLDFTAFGYAAFVMFPANGTVTLKNLAEAPDLASVKVLVNGVNVGFGVAAATGGFQASWNTFSVTSVNPVTPNVVIAWNSVPTPGSFALLGLASAVGFVRRRR